MTLQLPAHSFFPPADLAGSAAPLIRPGGSDLFWRAKRAFDIAMSLALLPVLAGLAVLLLCANPVANPGPLLVRQARMGRHCHAFTALKFRTMRPRSGPARGPCDPLEVDRITPLGTVLRRARFDELPQIINVLWGDMSLIGPRPDLFDHATAYLRIVPAYRARHAVRPGISGLAQVTLGYAEGVEATRAKTAADLTYLRQAGLRLEARIFWRTLVTIALRRGA